MLGNVYQPALWGQAGVLIYTICRFPWCKYSHLRISSWENVSRLVSWGADSNTWWLGCRPASWKHGLFIPCSTPAILWYGIGHWPHLYPSSTEKFIKISFFFHWLKRYNTEESHQIFLLLLFKVRIKNENSVDNFESWTGSKRVYEVCYSTNGKYQPSTWGLASFYLRCFSKPNVIIQ